MIATLRNILLAGFFFITAAAVNAQARFYATVTPEPVNSSDYIIYRIVVENASKLETIIPPSLKNFSLLSGPTQDDGMSSPNGQTTQFVSLEYVLKPKKPGKYRIEPARAIIGGKTLQCNAVNFVVKDGTAGSNSAPGYYSGLVPFEQQQVQQDLGDYVLHQGENIQEKVKKNMVVKLETDKKSCYVGQPVVATYKLYTRLKSDSKITQNPSFNGFSVVDIQEPQMTGYTRQKISGREYNVYTIRKVQLYALQPGNITLEPAELENDIQFIREEYARDLRVAASMFNDLPSSFAPPEAMVNESVMLKSDPVTIAVKALPEANKPAGFNGAVGDFSIESALQKPLFSTDEPGKLTVMVSGKGNMQLLTAPDISWPSGIEAFDPKFSENLEKSMVPVSGSKKFEYTFSVNDSGHYVLPSIKFSFFDPVTAAYKTLSTDPIAFQVIAGKAHGFSLAGLSKKIEEPASINKIFNHRALMVVAVALLVIFFLTAWLLVDKRSAQKDPVVSTIPKEEPVLSELIEQSSQNQQNVFSETEKCLYRDQCYDFFTLLNTELKHYLSQKFSLNANTIHSSGIVTVLDKKGIAVDTTLKLQRLMQEIEFQLYTPFERNERMDALYNEAHEVVQLINAQDFRHL